MRDRLRALVSRRIEAGDRSPVARALGGVWGLWSARGVARPLRLPEGVRVIGVGGATLGGAGKTPLAIAITRALAARGDRPALVGHAYRARPGRARVVLADDRVAEVGDDALACARLLDGIAEVVVGPRRQEAIDHAARLGHRVVVVDGLLQAAPRRVQASILTLDARDPWGSGACPPAGDLRAPREALIAAADRLAVIVPEGEALDEDLARLGAVPIASRVSEAIDASGERVPLASLAGSRVGLLVAIARPDRVARSLAGAGLPPAVTVALADHAAPSAGDLDRAARAGVSVWLTTARCATKLPARIGPAPVLAMAQRLDLGPLSALLGPEAGTDG